MRMQYNLMYNLMLLYIYINVTLCPILKPNLTISLRLLILTSIKELAGCIDRLCKNLIIFLNLTYINFMVSKFLIFFFILLLFILKIIR